MRSRLTFRAALPVLCAAWLTGSAQAACCYFSAKDKDVSQPGQKAFISWDPVETLETFTVQPKFEGNAVDFGMVVPTPGQPKLDEMPRDFFTDLALYTILMPLPVPIWPELRDIEYKRRTGSAVPAESGSGPRPQNGHGVTVLEAGVVGSLDYKILRAEQASGLFDWLKLNGYSYAGDEQTLDHYIRQQWFFTVMKIDPRQMKRNADGSYLGEVTPTRFTFETERLVYPLKITQISVPDKTDALFYVEAPEPMDLEGDWSWQHSFRVMWLTYMLGCAADERQQRELASRTEWVQQKRSKDPAFDTTKLEWARKLGPADIAVLELPLRNYAQMGGGDLPPGTRVISLQQFRDEVWQAYQKQGAGKDDERAKQRLEQLLKRHPEGKGQMVKVLEQGGPFLSAPYYWYPNREAPEAEVAGLSRLRGHLHEGRWLTKFRKSFRKDEMTQDLVLKPVEPAQRQEYVRILPTSPP